MNKLLGQFFTPPAVVSKMLKLRRNFSSVLEPSCGDGSFLSKLEETATGIEIDKNVANDPRIIVGDFFEYPQTERFDTIIGNPPYVRFQDISKRTKPLLPMELFDCRSNLYLFFMAKCIDHLNKRGELVFITPRDFLKATSARKLNKKLYEEGSITHYYELGDARIFQGAMPNCAIWRWEKSRKSREMETGGVFRCENGQIWFGSDTRTQVGDFFDVKVGAVSGADDVFANQKHGCTDMVCSRTATTGETRRVIYNRKDETLIPHKPKLLSRRIRVFNESNWWEWGRKFCRRSGPRIYVNGKTRNKKPFFISKVEAYDGSVLALFPKNGTNLEAAVEKLNGTDWEKLGFVCDGRLLFSQRSLATAPVDI